MMAAIKFVPAEDWTVLKKYLGQQTGVILVPDEVLAQMPKEKAEKLLLLSGDEFIEYDFGGEPDVMADLVLSPDAYAIHTLLGEPEDSE